MGRSPAWDPHKTTHNTIDLLFAIYTSTPRFRRAGCRKSVLQKASKRRLTVWWMGFYTTNPINRQPPSQPCLDWTGLRGLPVRRDLSLSLGGFFARPTMNISKTSKPWVNWTCRTIKPLCNTGMSTPRFRRAGCRISVLPKGKQTRAYCLMNGDLYNQPSQPTAPFTTLHQLNRLTGPACSQGP